MKPALTSIPRAAGLAILLTAALALTLACQSDGNGSPAAVPLTAAAMPAPAIPQADAGSDPGISADRVLFGQSAAFSGPAQALGEEMRRGINAAFDAANRAGGVHGRQLELVTLDDAYEPDQAYANTRRFVAVDADAASEPVFALIGAVGTPTSRAAVAVAQNAGVPFLAPFTGAELLRDPDLDNVLNLRASYYQETETMVARLTEDLGFKRIAVIYQNDSYGEAGLRGVEAALERRNLTPATTWYYQRNTSAVKTALLHLIIANPEAVIMIGAYAPVAEIITETRRLIDPVFMAVSFVGSNALSNALGADGAGVYVTQVVPFPDDTDLPAVAAYRRDLASYDADAVPGFVSLEGYLAGRLAIAGLQSCGPDLTRRCFLNALRDDTTLDLDGFTLAYGPGDNQGSDAVYLTMIDADGNYRPVERLEGAP